MSRSTLVIIHFMVTELCPLINKKKKKGHVCGFHALTSDFSFPQ